MHNQESVLENEMNKLFWDFEIPNLGQTTRPSESKKKKKRTCRIVEFAVQADHREKFKGSQKSN